MYKKNKINERIRSPKVRLVGDNIEQGVYDTNDALRISKELGLDLVELSPNASPPVCKIIEFKKFIYDKKKKEKDLQRKQKTNQVQIKEIRLTPNTDDHDFNFKLNHAKKFLENNNKVKVSIFFKGREIIYKDAGEIILLKFVDNLIDYGVPESLPKLEGKRMSIFIKPKKKNV